jgi:regulation of enolase protein 1 (concanavalin A-like superfamily)
MDARAPAPAAPRDAASPTPAVPGSGAAGQGGGVAGPGDAGSQVVPLAKAPAAPLDFPEAWKVENIGGGASSTKARYFMGSSATYIILSTGSRRIADRDDSFQFVYQPVRGDAEIIGRVRNVDFTAPGAQAGLMIRASTAPGAPNVMIAVTGGLLGHVQARTTSGGDTVKNDADKANLRLNTWFRLVRTGKTVKAYRGDRRTWTEVGSYDLDLPQDALFGLAATSGLSDLEGRFEFDGARINNFPATRAMPTWLHEDVGLFGGVAIAETGTTAALRLQAFGVPWTDTNDFHGFAFREVMGDHSLVFRVRSVDEAVAGARVVAMIRNGSATSVSRGHAHLAAGLTIGKGLELRHRVNNGNPAMTGEAVPFMKPPVWLRVERTGKTFRGAYSLDGSPGSWKELGVVELNMGTTVSVGVAVSSNDNRKLLGAVVDNITLSVTAPAGDGGVADAGPPDARVPDAGRDVAPDRRR